MSSTSLASTLKERYLKYAMSVIVGRALPDVRDGLKPVQRRILYTMYNNLGLTYDGRYRKSAAVVGEVMAKYHPHGDSAIYDAMVRMAQDFSLQHPFVNGQGNFGSIDGDNAAAYRYTEAKLTRMASDFMADMDKDTVFFEPTYDGSSHEPTVIPAPFPNLLVNGTEGIAVGMATSIPPHNLGEVIDATLHLIDHPHASVKDLLSFVKGPDSPLGGEILSQDMESIYTEGKGSVTIQASWTTETKGRKTYLVITSIPYAENRAKIVEKIGVLLEEKKIPQASEVRDESSEDTRIVLTIKDAQDAPSIMAFLYKNTGLLKSLNINMNCLIPYDGTLTPVRLSLKDVLTQWLDFRFDVVSRRLTYNRNNLARRLHILQGFVTLFSHLQTAIDEISKRTSRKDVADYLRKAFSLDDEQIDAILDIKIYRLSQNEMSNIKAEKDAKEKEMALIDKMLGDDGLIWGVIKDELADIKKMYAKPRQTRFTSEQLKFDAKNFIVSEDTYVLVSAENWIRRQTTLGDLSKARSRDGDRIVWGLKMNTAHPLIMVSNQGVCYTMMVGDVPSTSGYGEPLSKYFNMDGATLVGVMGKAYTHILLTTKQGKMLQVAIDAYLASSTKNGRRIIKLEDNDVVVSAIGIKDPTETVTLVSSDGKALSFAVSEVSVTGIGKGVTGIKLSDGAWVDAVHLNHADHVKYLGARASKGKKYV